MSFRNFTMLTLESSLRKEQENDGVLEQLAQSAQGKCVACSCIDGIRGYLGVGVSAADSPRSLRSNREWRNAISDH